MSADEPGADRPSRQSLVVPPARSNLPVAIGAMACGCAGFALVWAFGIGRPAPLVPAEPVQVVLRPASDGGAEAAAATEAGQPPVVREPRPFLVPEVAIRPVAPPERSNARHDSSADRYAVRAASLDVPGAVVPTAGESRPLSRFSAPADLPPAEPAAAVEPSDPVDEPTQPSAATVTEPPSLVAPPGPEVVEPAAEVRAEPEDLVANSDVGPARPSEPSDSEVATPAPLAAAPPVAPPVAQPVAQPVDATPRSTSPVVNAPAPPASDSAGAVSAFAAASAFAPPIPRSAPAPLPPTAAPAKPLLPDVPPVPVSQPRVASAADAVPYAAAPALVPRQDGQPPAQALVPPAAQGQATGPGRPGPMQLEGVQSPQLTVEKRGPREVQVGKAARYEIFVRNVGSAVAQDVTLRDAIPQGTTLVATTPPASPVAASGGGEDGELVWPLGTLPPGGQVRVVMEVMPQAEGEIGSIASVSFRADASVRSRATKPDLRVEVTQPAPVLIHGDMQLALKVANVGSGAATGIVLEGFLPDNVSHRSGRELEFDVGQLRPGESRTIDLVLGTCGPGVQAARFIVRADGGIEVSEQTKIEVTAPTLEAAIDMPLRRFLQRPATCTIAMTNAGTAPARAIELAAQLPPGLKFVRANNAGWHDERTHRVLWSLEELPAGETGTVEVVVMPVDLGPQKIMAAARSGDGLAAQAAHVCEVEGLAALVFDVADSEDPVEVNGLTEYVVRVTNQGTKPATGVRVSAGLLGDLEPVEAQGPVAHRVENLSIAFDPLAKLAPSEEAVFRIRVRGRRAGDQRVQVQLVSEDHPAPITKEEITRVYADR